MTSPGTEDTNVPELRSATPAFPVQDIERAIAFYARALSFSVVAQGPGFAVIRRGQVDLHLWLSNDERWRERDAGSPLLSGAESFLAGTASCRIEVSGIRDLFDACTGAGIVHPNGPLRHVEYGAMEFAVLDHEGNLITFYQMD